MIESTANNVANCQHCVKIININEVYYRCPKKSTQCHPEGCVLCVECFNNERQTYTGSITLGQRVRIKIGHEWKLGSIIQHWIDDDTYSIQLDGQKRSDAEAYNMYVYDWLYIPDLLPMK